jgi:hypothetical protein
VSVHSTAHRLAKRSRSPKESKKQVRVKEIRKTRKEEEIGKGDKRRDGEKR